MSGMKNRVTDRRGGTITAVPPGGGGGVGGWGVAAQRADQVAADGGHPVGRMLMNAMYSPPPVAVMAGAYLRMMSDGSGSYPGVIELNVWRIATTVPISPRSGNHSAPWARWVSQRSGAGVEVAGRFMPQEGPPGQHDLRDEEREAEGDDDPVDRATRPRD